MLQQNRLTGGETNTDSLDTVFTVFYGTLGFKLEATMAHQRMHKDMLEMHVGDIIACNPEWSKKFYPRRGYFFGNNTNTGKLGYFPTYKTKRIHQIVDFPKYSRVKL